MKYKDKEYGTYLFAIAAVIVILSYKLFYKDISRNIFSTSSVLLLIMLSVFLIIIVGSIFNIFRQSSNTKKNK